MKVTGDWLHHPGTQAVLTRLGEAGFAAYAVGGCVRNDLLGAPVADIDVASDATPRDVMRVFDGERVIPTGIDHGTMTVIIAGRAHEITTFRRDVATDGRHAEVAFGTDISVDAARRDFTMNALYADAAGDVLDPVGGLPDLMARRLVFIGDAGARIAEDYLRILRFFRFTAWYATSMDAEGLAACAALQDGLDGLSRERVGHEMRKLLAAPDPAPAVAAMAAAGILARVLPSADPRALAPLVHLEGDLPPYWPRRLVALGGDPAGLRLSKQEAREVRVLREAATGTDGPFALGHLLGAERGRDAALLRAALLESPVMVEGIKQGARADFPLQASDLRSEGPQLGADLKRAKAIWLRSNGTMEAAALIAALDSAPE